MLPVRAKKEGLDLKAFSSFLIALPRVTRHDPFLAVMLDLVAPEAAAKALSAHLLGGASVYVYNKEWHEARLAYGRNFRVVSARVGEAAHFVLVAGWLLQAEAPLAWRVDQEEALWRLANRGRIPILREWLAAEPVAGLIRHYLRPMEIVGELPGVTVWQGGLPLERLEETVRDLLRRGELSLPGHTEGKPLRLAGADTLEKYLAEFGRELGAKVTSLYAPLRRPDDPPHPRLQDLLRRPYRAQADVIQACAEAHKCRRALVVCGEMGTGKTLIAAAAPYLARGKYRVLVMCPAHLVNKWKREVEMTVPGARAVILASWKEAKKLLDPARSPAGPEYFIVSKETAKLGYFRRPGAVYRKALCGRKGKVLRDAGWYCPDCGRILLDRHGVPLEESAFERPRESNKKCSRCGCSLWQADRGRVRKISVADVVRRLPKGYFDLFVADETQDYKGRTAQGAAFGLFAARAKRTLALTGTLLGGYAADLFYLLQHLDGENLRREGLDYRSLQEFVARYGVLERVTRGEDADRLWTARASKPRTYLYQRPGASPALFSRHLLESTAFLELADLAIDLPEYTEEVAVIPMSEELAAAYRDLEAGLKALVGNAMSGRGRKYLGAYLTNLLSYPDRPWDNPPILNRETNTVAVEPRELPRDVLYPKEEYLLDVVRREAAAGRRVFVYLVYTNTRDVAGRLEEVLKNAGFSAAVLRASVEPAKREEWLEKAVKGGAQVVIANAELVKTGLDLYNFPTLVFYQTGYNLYTLRQAARRSWRIGQEKPVRVLFFAYENTMQDAALRLMGRKLQAALAIEGKFSAEGLLALAEGADVLVELARTLLEGMEGLESAEALWRSAAPKEKDRAVRLIATVSYFKRVAGRRRRVWEEAPPDAAVAQLAFDFGALTRAGN